MPDIFNSILNGTTGLGTFLICIMSSVIFGILISIVYILTHRKRILQSELCYVNYNASRYCIAYHIAD